MSSFPWCRLYHETLSDRKIKLVAIETGQPKPLIMGVWTSLLMLANESPERGRLLSGKGQPLSFPFMADEIGLSETDLQAILNEFMEMGMIHVDDGGVLVITNWEDRQFKSDNSTERVKRFRAKKQKSESPPLPDDNRNGTGEEVDSNEYTKRFRNVSETDQSQIQSQSQIDSTTTTTNARARKETFAQICQTYENEIGLLSPMVRDMIADDSETYPADWIIQAIQIAVKRQKRNWGYIEGILKQWRSIGGPQNDKPPERKVKQDAAHQGHNSRFGTGHDPTLNKTTNPYTGETVYLS